MYKKAAFFFFGIIVLALIFLAVKSFSPKAPQVTQNKIINDYVRFSIVAQNLEIPWGLAFLPDGRMLVTERPGRVRLISKEGNLLPAPVATISAVKHIGEGGLLGIAIHPQFTSNSYVYLYYTYADSGNRTLNRVSRFKLENDQLTGEEVIVDNIPGAPNHNGGRIKFGPDKLLYITTGDAQNPSEAQDKNSLAGKILRVSDEKKLEIFSYGHRNPQGLAWDNQGRLWATEHGPSTKDELNLVAMGKNYGWPAVTGDEEKPGLEKNILNSGSATWAPAGAAFYRGSIFFGGLRGTALFEKTADNKLKEHFKNQFGRIRDVVLGPDNLLYITTSNRDGRGSVKENDDKIIRINPQESHPLQISEMRKKSYPGSEITIEEELEAGPNYKRFLTSYKTEGLKIYALLTVPEGNQPEGGWPAIIFNHGYIPPTQYTTTGRYVAYTDAFSKGGYIVFKPDFRGHGSSEGNPEGAYYSPAYTTDVLNAVSSIKKYPEVNPQKLGMWGHSMGGSITLRSMVVTSDIKAGVIWAGVVASYEDMIKNWRRARPFMLSEREQFSRRPGRQALIDKYGDTDKNPGFWQSIAPIYFVKDISGPLQLHHGTSDEEVPLLFSEKLNAAMKGAGKEVEFFSYEGDDHNISGNLSQALTRSVEFFDKYLK